MQDRDEIPNGLELVDDRAPICPNGHGLMDKESNYDMKCRTCGYSRQVLREVSRDPSRDVSDDTSTDTETAKDHDGYPGVYPQ